MQNVESSASVAIKNIKKAVQAAKLEDGQRSLDKVISQAEAMIKSINLAKEYASDCGCSEGTNTATLLLAAVSDLLAQTKDAADQGVLSEQKEAIKKLTPLVQGIKDQASDGLSYCFQ